MELIVQLSQPVLVMPGESQLHKQDTADSPPAYGVIFPSTISSHSLASSSTLSSSCAATNPRLTAIITLKLPSSNTAVYSLSSLTAKLVATESLAYNNGGFEQSCPVNSSVHVPLPPRLDIQPGQTCKFQAEISCPAHMPPSVQLPDARLKYNVRVKAKVQPTRSKDRWLRSVFQGKTLTDQADLLVVQATVMDSEQFSLIRYIPIGGLGWTCISMNPSPCLIGQTTWINFTLAHPEAKQKIASIDLTLVQETKIRSRHLSCPSSQSKPRLFFQLETVPRPTSPMIESVSEKARVSAYRSGLFEKEFHIPDQTDMQPSTLSGSTSVIHVSHHLQLTIRYFEPTNPTAEKYASIASSWPITLSHPDAISRTIAYDLPPYTPSIDFKLKQHPFEPCTPSSTCGINAV